MPLEKLSATLTQLKLGQITIGLARTKFLAKTLLLSTAKNYTPEIRSQQLTGGILIRLIPGKEESYLSNLPVQFLWPLDSKTRARLIALGIKKVKELANISPHMLALQFGREAKKILYCCQGKDTEQLLNLYPGESVIFTCNNLLYSQEQLYVCLNTAASYLAGELNKTGRGCSMLSLTVCPAENLPVTENRQFNHTAWSQECIWGALRNLAVKLFLSVPIQRVEVKASNISPVYYKQISLFDNYKRIPYSAKNYSQIDFISKLQRKHGTKAIYFGNKLSFSRQERLLSEWDYFI